MSQTTNSPNAPSGLQDLSATTIIESLPDAVVIAEAESGTVVSANGAAEELFECQRADLVGRNQSELHPAEDAELYQEAFARGLENETVERLRDGRPLYVETALGERKPVEINAQRLQSQGQPLVIGVFREISSRLEREQELERTATRLDTLLDSAPLPIAVLDTDGTVELWNSAAEETLGYSASEIVGERYPLFVDQALFAELIDRVTGGDPVDGYQTTLRARDGSRIEVEIYAHPLYENGTITGIIGSAVDITDRRQQQQHLDVIHRILRHNLRNNLSVIQPYASMLAEGAEPGAGTATAGAKILDAAEDLAQLSSHAAQVRREIRASDTLSCPLSELLATVRDTLADTPATVEGPVADASVSVSAQTDRALSWLLARIVEYTDDPGVSVAVDPRANHIELHIRGPTPLLPAGDAALITTGTETALKHGQSMDVARAYLTLTSVGGEIIQTDDTSARRSFRIEVPRLDTDTGLADRA